MEESTDRRMRASSILLVRLMLSSVFISEGIQKFLFPDVLGVGRFIKIGIPFPSMMAPFVGCVEIACGALLLAGLFTRLATIPVIISMLVAFGSTKIPMLIEKGFWPFAHEARVDWCMLLGLFSVLLVGGGQWSMDHYQSARKSHSMTVPRL
jgi:putative oxidoreductase